LPRLPRARGNPSPISLLKALRATVERREQYRYLLSVATAAQLFHATDGTPFADLIIDGHRETWPLRSKRFRAWLRQQYYERTWMHRALAR
jgi:hypothetical protein